MRIALKARDEGIDSLTDEEREAYRRIIAVSTAEIREQAPSEDELASAGEFVSDETIARLRRMLGH